MLNSHHKGLVMQNFDVFFVVSLHKLLNKHLSSQIPQPLCDISVIQKQSLKWSVIIFWISPCCSEFEFEFENVPTVISVYK